MPSQQEILIVDDKSANLRALEETLGGLEVNTVRAETGNDALAATLNHDFALCILDVQMPGMSGYELAEILKGDAKTRFVPIIFLTAALLEQEQMLKGYEVGGVDYVVKPYNPFVLLSKVRVFLELDRQRAKLVEQREKMQALFLERETKDRLIQRQARAIEISQLQKMSALGRMAASLTHELNQPLNVIRIVSGDIRRDLQKERFDYSRLESCMTDITGQVVRMARIVDHVRLYSRKVDDVERRPIPAGRPVDAALELLSHQMQIDQVAVSVEMEDGLKVAGDQLRLEQVFVNLLGNACDAMNGDANCHDKKLGVSIYSEEQGSGEAERVVFAISDNGPGVPLDVQAQIFEPFFTGKGRGEGTGLGLSITKEIVEDHDGTIEVESTTVQGATFKVTLPAWT